MDPFRRRLILGAAVSLVHTLAHAPASADGDDFFQPTDVPLDSQLVFVGKVKDQAGGYVGGALVTWRATASDGETDQISSSGTFTDNVGRYRTVDVARVVNMNGLEFDARRVEVSVTKPGYTMLRRLKRSRGTQSMGLIEVDFVMARSPQTDKAR